MGAATLADTLWDRFLKHNPRSPHWPDRDRFVLSPGHASMLLYALLHLTGYDLPLEELRGFRQWGSKTPGHPEYGLTPGVEATTGPLGQGFANGVGMAIAERWMADHYNRLGHEIINHYPYAIVSDGDMQEGVTSEAASLAGTLRLGKLIYLYDDNDIQIEGPTDTVFSENVARRFLSYDWQVLGPIDGQDIAAIEKAISEAQAETECPSLIICKTVIGYGSPAQATARVHGEPLGEENVRAAKETLGWPQEPAFYVPDEVLAHTRNALDRGRQAEEAWQQSMAAYRDTYPGLADEFEAQLRGELPPHWDEGLADLFPPGSEPVATRAASGQALNALVKRVHALTGGSADLAPSTKTRLIFEGAGDLTPENLGGRNIHFGVREHAMGAILNGLSHCKVRPYGSGFLIFSDYMRPAIRLSALMEIPVIYIFTHDSIGVGEDGPTHQPVEQLASLRAIPGVTVLRPADANEVARLFGINTGADRFFLEEHPKLEPVSTPTSGVFLAGTCQGPKDIPDTVAQAKGAASEALALASRGEVLVEPLISSIDADLCIGCQVCVALCPYSAIEFDWHRHVSVVNEAKCKGCGSCAAHCPSGAAKVRHFTDEQIFAEIEGILAA